jgi:hypothetical protein
MGRLWLLVTILVLPLLMGCGMSQADPPLPAAAVSPPDAKTPPPRSAVSPSDVRIRPPVTAAKPAAKPPQKAAARQPARRLWDDFDLPLVIELQVPEAPPEIRKPSPPIQAQPKLP